MKSTVGVYAAVTQARSRAESIFRISCIRASKTVRVLRRPRYLAGVIHGVMPATEHELSGLSGPYAAIYDVGASKGQFAYFATANWPQCKIVCFEPLLERAEGLRAALGDRVVVEQVALGATEGPQILHIARNDDSSSILPITRQSHEFPGTAEVATATVEMRLMSDYIDEPKIGKTLVKIDVQGYELDVLKGCDGTLKYIDEILCECSFVELYEGQALAGDVVTYLHSQGFSLASVTGIVKRRGVALQADFRFIRNG